MDYTDQLQQIATRVEALTDELTRGRELEHALVQQSVELEQQLTVCKAQINIEQDRNQKVQRELEALSKESEIYEKLVRIPEHQSESELRLRIQELEDVNRVITESERLKVVQEFNVESLRAIREYVRSDLTSAYKDLAKQHEGNGDLDSAIRELEKAKRICNEFDSTRVRADLASLFERRSESAEDYECAAEEWKAIEDIKRQEAALVEAAHLYRKEQEYLEAIRVSYDALMLLEPAEMSSDIQTYLRRISSLGKRAEKSVSNYESYYEEEAYRWAIQYYESKGINPEYFEELSEYIEGLGQLIKLVTTRDLKNIKELAEKAKERLEKIRKEIVEGENNMRNSYDMCALPSELYSQLRGALSSCGPFSTDRELQAIFVDRRISPWRENVPQASSRVERVEALVNFLCDKHDARGENALVLFLSVLKDRAHPGDACPQRLANLVDELKSSTSPADISNPQPNSNATTIQYKRQELAKYEQNLHRLNIQIASHGGETSAPIAMLDQRDEIATKIASLQAELRNLER